MPNKHNAEPQRTDPSINVTGEFSTKDCRMRGAWWGFTNTEKLLYLGTIERTELSNGPI